MLSPILEDIPPPLKTYSTDSDRDSVHTVAEVGNLPSLGLIASRDKFR